MALPPHPLDSVFEKPDNFEHAFTTSHLFKTAIAKAKAAYMEQEQAYQQHPGLCGAGANQSARNAFLATLSGE